jgi:hypothetical protein
MGAFRAASAPDGNELRRSDLPPFLAIRETLRRASRGNPATAPRHQPSAKKTNSTTTLGVPAFATRGDSMRDTPTDLIRPVPSIVPSDVPAMSDDECLLRLARALEDPDQEQLDEVARLIGRLAVTIE